MNRDYSVVFPVAALVIMLILALLLRSLVAPVYLMAAVGLGFGATLGATALVFQHIKGDAGLIFILPIYIYLFVVALGTDYNILMIARLREEAREGLAPRDAAAETIKHGGPTVAAAGVILAGTFASLMLGGNSFFVSMGFALSFGILISAFVMAMFFTPAVTALLGHAAWWPGHGDEKQPEKVEASRLSALGGASAQPSSAAQLLPLGTDRGVVAVAGVHDRVVGQGEQLVPDRRLERGQVRVRPAGGARAALEQGVAGEHAAEVRGVEAAAARARGPACAGCAASYRRRSAPTRPAGPGPTGGRCG